MDKAYPHLQVFEVKDTHYRWRLVRGYRQYKNTAISCKDKKYICLATRETDGIGRGYTSLDIHVVVREMQHFMAHGSFSDGTTAAAQ